MITTEPTAQEVAAEILRIARKINHDLTIANHREKQAKKKLEKLTKLKAIS